MIDWDGRSRQPCPDCDRGPRDTALSVTINDDGSAVAFCHRCGFTATNRGSERPGTALRTRQGVHRHERLSEFGRELWDSCSPLAGEARAYLEARCCVVPPTDGDLRWHPALKHPPSGQIGPALVALVTDAESGRPLTLHRTWVRADGNKAALDPPRMLLGGHRKAGGVVRLWPDDSVTLGLGIGEGIETALSLAHAFTPVWACIDAGNMAELPVLEGIESLLIAADNDAAGIGAANICGVRWAAQGRDARIVMPDGHRLDLNDVARAP